MYRFRFTPHTQVTGIENIRPGIDGDQVSVELLPFQKWEDSSNDLLLDSEEDDVDETPGVSGMPQTVTKPKAGSSDRFDKVVSGRVVKVEEMGKREFVCSLSASNEVEWVRERVVRNRDMSHLVVMVPMNKRIPCCMVYSSYVSDGRGSEG